MANNLNKVFVFHIRPMSDWNESMEQTDRVVNPTAHELLNAKGIVEFHLKRSEMEVFLDDDSDEGIKKLYDKLLKWTNRVRINGKTIEFLNSTNQE